MANVAKFKGKPVRFESLPAWARESIPAFGIAKRLRDPDRPRGLKVLEAVEKGYVTKNSQIMLYRWSDRRVKRGPGLPSLGGEFLERWYEYEVDADRRILRFIVFSAPQLKSSKEAKALQAKALLKTRGITDRQFVNQYPDLFRRKDGSLPKRRPTIFFYWRNKGCPYLKNGRPMHHWRERGRIVNDPLDVSRIAKKARSTNIKEWTDPQTGESHTPITLNEFRELTGMIEQEVYQYREKRPHSALGRNIAYLQGKRSAGRTNLGFGYRYSREDAERIAKWYEAKANGQPVGKLADAMDFLLALVSPDIVVRVGDGMSRCKTEGLSLSLIYRGLKAAKIATTPSGRHHFSVWHRESMNEKRVRELIQELADRQHEPGGTPAPEMTNREEIDGVFTIIGQSATPHNRGSWPRNPAKVDVMQEAASHGRKKSGRNNQDERLERNPPEYGSVAISRFLPEAVQQLEMAKRKKEVTIAHVAITEDDETILKCLVERYPRLYIQEDIAACTGLSRKTIGERLSKLAKDRLVKWPEGERKGVTLTIRGLHLFEEKFLPQSH